ncbi:MAG: PAS domain-containing protein [Thermodesulfobacteriota bacterium]
MATRARLEYLLTTGPVVVYSCEPGGVYAATWMSENIKTQLGYEPREFIDNPDFWAGHIHPEDRPRVFTELSCLVERGHHIHEYRFRHKDGTYRWMRDELRLLRDAAGNPREIVGYWIDITDRKQIEEALRRAEQEKEIILDSMSERVIYHDPERKILWANRVAGESGGLDPGQLVGRHCHEVCQPSGQSCAGCPVAKALATGQPQEAEMPACDRKVWSIRAYPVKDARGGVLGIVQVALEIAERKRLEEQLLQAQKMQMVGRLAGGIAHDFNNLLTAITGYADLLLLRVNPGEPLRRDVEQIKKAAERATSLTGQLLALSRRQVLQPRVLDLNLLIVDVDKLLGRLIGEDIELVTLLAPGLRRVRADPGQLGQVIMNLAVNARDAMPEGGKLTIRTEDVTVDESYCHLMPEARPGKFVCLSVADTGAGMGKGIIEHIFEPFFSTKEDGKGTGLGLAVVYGIVKQHEGWINVYSEPGKGSVFKVYLPAFSIPPDEETEETISLPELQGRGEQILLAEDEEEVRKFAARVLRENGYFVFEAATANEAMDISEREKGDLHLVFSDVVLPDGTGLELVDRLLSGRPQIRVLLSSGYTDEKLQRALIREKGFCFLRKPYGLADLLRAVREAIHPG